MTFSLELACLFVSFFCISCFHSVVEILLFCFLLLLVSSFCDCLCYIFRVFIFMCFPALGQRGHHAALFLLLGLPPTLIRHINGAVFFNIALQTGGIWKRRLFVFMWKENNLKTGLFENSGHSHIMWFPSPSYLQTQIQNVAFRNCSGIIWTENIWLVFRVKLTSVFKFLQCSVARISLILQVFGWHLVNHGLI